VINHPLRRVFYLENAMASIWSANLTCSEIERYAYLYGKKHLASFAADLEDQDEAEERHEQELQDVHEEAFENGKAEGLGLDANKLIDALQKEITDLKASHQRCRGNLQAVSEWLRVSDNHNTLAKRKAYADKVRSALNTISRY
jgi:hypothetical protein